MKTGKSIAGLECFSKNLLPMRSKNLLSALPAFCKFTVTMAVQKIDSEPYHQPNQKPHPNNMRFLCHKIKTTYHP